MVAFAKSSESVADGSDGRSLQRRADLGGEALGGGDDLGATQPAQLAGRHEERVDAVPEPHASIGHWQN